MNLVTRFSPALLARATHRGAGISKLLTCRVTFSLKLNPAPDKVNGCRVSGTMAPIGRRPGKPDHRASSAGHRRADVRRRRLRQDLGARLAAGAGVDPALIRHYSAQGGAVPGDDGLAVRRRGGRRAGHGGRKDEIGARLTQVFFDAWERPESRAPLQAILRGAATHEESATLVRQFIRASSIGRSPTRSLARPPNCGSTWRWPNCWASPTCATSCGGTDRLDSRENSWPGHAGGHRLFDRLTNRCRRAPGARGLRRYADTSGRPGQPEPPWPVGGLADPDPRTSTPPRSSPSSSRTGLSASNKSIPLSSMVIPSAEHRLPGPRAKAARSHRRRGGPGRRRARRRPRPHATAPRPRTPSSAATRRSRTRGCRGCDRCTAVPAGPNIIALRPPGPRKECDAASGHGPSGGPPYASTSTTVAVTPRPMQHARRAVAGPP